MSIFRRFSIPILILTLAEILLFLYFPPSLIFEKTVTAGGDTPSHFMSALALQNLSSFFSPVTWSYGAFGGFPLFLQYFPLPFALMAIVSLVTSLQVAFKLVTLAAIVPLPAAVYYSLRRMGLQGAIPALGAVLSLPFLMQTGNHMWGGNIASTLAGEFAFGISFILTVILWGRLYADAPQTRSLAANSFIEALVALGNGYPILQAGLGTSYFLVRGKSIRYVLSLHALAFGLAAFWLLPLIRFVSWNSSYGHSWAFTSASEIVPYLLWPSIAGAIIGLLLHLPKLPGIFSHPGAALRSECKPNPEQYLWWQFGISLLCFALAPRVGIVDARFLPFSQIAVAMLGAIGWGRLIERLPRPNLWAGAFAAAVMAFSVAGSTTVQTWIKFNYSGMEKKPAWRSFSALSDYIAGSENDPRVVYEHSEMITGAGTTRAFEMLPYYSGRSTIEGLYMQSSITAPFAYYIQSEISSTPSTPLPDYYYSRLDPARAAQHLRLFNADLVISASDTVHNSLDYSPDFELQISFPPFRVYKVQNAENTYVTPLRFRPARISERDWKQVQFDWFRKSSLRVPLLVTREDLPGEYWKTLQPLAGPPENMPEIPIEGADEVKADALLSDNRIVVNTSSPGHPLWIKVSYHPSWRIDRGEGELYLVSPTFMLLVPRTREVVLAFKTSGGVYLAGKVASVVALLLCMGIISTAIFRKHRLGSNTPGSEQQTSRSTDPQKTRAFVRRGGAPFSTNWWFIGAAALMAGLVAGCLLFRSELDAQLLYGRAGAKFDRTEDIRKEIEAGTAGPELKAEREKLISETLVLLGESISKFPDSFVFDHNIYLRAYFLLEKGETAEVRAFLEEFLSAHPDTRILSECLWLMGESYFLEAKTQEAEEYFRSAALVWPESNAGRLSILRLAEMLGTESIYRAADEFFSSGNYPAAYCLLRALTFHADQEVRDPSTLSLAYCCFYLNRWEEASKLFMQWLSTHFDSPESAEARKTLLQCEILQNHSREWLTPADEGETIMERIIKLFKPAA